MAHDVVDEVNKEMYDDMKKMFSKGFNMLDKMLKNNRDSKRREEQQKKLEEFLKELKEKLEEKEKEMGLNKEDSRSDKSQAFKEQCPDTYKNVQQQVVNSSKETLNDISSSLTSRGELSGLSLEQQSGIISSKLGLISSQKIANNITTKGVFGSTHDAVGIFEGKESPEFEKMMDEYLKDEYEDLSLDDYRDTNGKIDYQKLMEETDIGNDVFEPFLNEVANDRDTIQQIDQHKNILRGEQGKDIDGLINHMGLDKNSNEKDAGNIINDIADTFDDMAK